MNINHTKMTLEINSCKNYEILEVRQGDKGSRIIDFAFTVNGETVELTSTMSAKVNATVDDVIVADSVAAVVDTENNVVTVTLTDTMLALSGICKMDIVLTEGDEIITAETVCLRVGKSVINDDSKAFPGASSIVEITKEVKNARGSQNSLGARLDTVDTNLTKKANKSDVDSINSRLQSTETTLKNKANIADVSNALTSKADKVDVTNRLSKLNEDKTKQDANIQKLFSDVTDISGSATPLIAFDTSELNGITFTNNKDGSVTINGTSTERTAFAITNKYNISKGNYLFDSGVNMLPTGFNLRLNAKGDANLSSNKAKTSFITKENKYDNIMYIVITSGSTFETFTIKPTLFKTDTLLDDINIEISGNKRKINAIGTFKDIYQYLDKTKAIDGEYYKSAGVIGTATQGGYWRYPELKLDAGTYYYSSFDRHFSFAVGDSGNTFAFTKSSGAITFDEPTTVYVTNLYGNTDKDACMLSNDTLPTKYAYGIIAAALIKSNINVEKSYIVVDASGNGDYTNIQDAVDNANDSESNHVTIVVMAGVYPRFDAYSRTALRYLDIIGINKNSCIVKDSTANYDKCSANLRINGTLKNLTFKNTTENHTVDGSHKYSYAVHNDFGPSVTLFENCNFYSEGGPAVGMGIYAGSDITFENCEFTTKIVNEIGTPLLGALYCHASNTTNGQKITLRNCIVNNKSGNITALLDYLNYEDALRTAILISNVFYGTSGAKINIRGKWDYEYSFGNNVEL